MSSTWESDPTMFDCPAKINTRTTGRSPVVAAATPPFVANRRRTANAINFKLGGFISGSEGTQRDDPRRRQQQRPGQLCLGSKPWGSKCESAVPACFEYPGGDPLALPERLSKFALHIRQSFASRWRLWPNIGRWRLKSDTWSGRSDETHFLGCWRELRASQRRLPRLAKQLQALPRTTDVPILAKRLDCGAFTAAFPSGSTSGFTPLQAGASWAKCQDAPFVRTAR